MARDKSNDKTKKEKAKKSALNVKMKAVPSSRFRQNKKRRKK